MQAKPVHIIEYFDGTKQSLIPLFQRPYRWENTNWRALWNDIVAVGEFADAGAHFMGAVVSVPAVSVPVGVVKHLVIDGQQRLTTIAILLCALRDTPGFSAQHKGIIEDYLVNRHYVGSDRPKLLPTQGDRSAFLALVEGRLDAPDLAGHRMLAAYRFFCSEIGTTAASGVMSAEAAFDLIRQRLVVVMINLEKTDDPYLIFESLNAKGEPLSEADLVRNYVLMRFSHSAEDGGEQAQVYQQIWRPLEEQLGEYLLEFLRHYTMRNGRDVRKGRIYRAVKDDFETAKESEALQRRLADLAAYGDDYAKLRYPSREAHPAIAARLQNFHDLDLTVLFPLVMRLFAARRGGRMDDSMLAAALAAIESFHVRRLACGIPTNALNKLCLSWCNAFPEHGELLPWLAGKLTGGSGNSRCPGDDEFRASLQTQMIYYRKNLVRHLLCSLEVSFGHKETVSFTGASIEHVMPQTLSQQWREDLGDAADETYSTLLHTLGNLTLSGYNIELYNDPFDKKRTELAKSHFELNRAIVAETKWTAFEITRRAADLAARAVTVWPFPQ